MKNITIFVSKETNDYIIDTSNSAYWRLLANREILPGEIIIQSDDCFFCDAPLDTSFIVELKETGEQKQVYRETHAVPNNIKGRKKSLEFPWCFMNHSCNPNTVDKYSEIDPHNFSLAETYSIFNIAIHEELTYDYALENYSYDNIICHCGSTNCRHIVSGFDQLDCKDQRLLLKYASPFVQHLYYENDLGNSHLSNYNHQSLPVKEHKSTQEGVDEMKRTFTEKLFTRSNNSVYVVFEYSKLLANVKTKFQHCVIFDSLYFGRILTLDNIIQLSSFDEHIYHEMIVHPVMMIHEQPMEILVVGGGDGGTLRELMKYNINQVVLIDIDSDLVNLSKKYFPDVSNHAFEDKRALVIHNDASIEIKNFCSCLDIVIIDCTDNKGPSESLFERDFYANIKNALRVNGLCCIQAGSSLNHEYLNNIRSKVEPYFSCIYELKCTIPSFLCGEYVFYILCDVPELDQISIHALMKRFGELKVSTKYWTPSIHAKSIISV